MFVQSRVILIFSCVYDRSYRHTTQRLTTYPDSKAWPATGKVGLNAVSRPVCSNSVLLLLSLFLQRMHIIYWLHSSLSRLYLSSSHRHADSSKILWLLGFSTVNQVGTLTNLSLWRDVHFIKILCRFYPHQTLIIRISHITLICRKFELL